MRPSIKEDGGGEQSQVIVDYDAEDDGVVYVEHRGNVKAFEVDKVFRPSSTQTEVRVTCRFFSGGKYFLRSKYIDLKPRP